MSLTELEPYEPPRAASEDFGRTPPQDVAAEMSVLGGMMLSKDAIADVVEQIRGADFYRPAHEMVFEAILDLYGRGEPADAITVAGTLTTRGEIGRVGGQAYLHTLISSVPTAANAGYYARIVRERAVLRRLVEAGTRIVQLGYAAEGGDVDALVNTAQAEVYAVTERRTSEDYVPLGSVIEATIDEIEAAGHRGGGMTGVPTGFTDLDQLTNGLHPGQMIVIAARPAIGKALALDTPLATPHGWTTMGEVAVGDEVMAADGTPTRVVAATEVMDGRPCYEVVFDDGTTIVADAEHQWLTQTLAERRTRSPGRIRTTEQIASTLTCPHGPANHSVGLAAALSLPEAALPLPPYAVGAWLASVGLADAHRSHASPSSVDDEVMARIEAEGYRLRRAVGTAASTWELAGPEGPGGALALVEAPRSLLQGMGLDGDRHIPGVYLRASRRQRYDLLAGLLDVAARVDPAGGVHLPLASSRVAADVMELITTLGYRPALATASDPARPQAEQAYDVTFTTADDVCWLDPTSKGPTHEAATHRFITRVRAVPSVPVRCIEVEHPHHLYLAGTSMVPTHNSTIGLDIARSASIKNGLASVVFSLEMSKTEITMRLLSAEAKIPLQNMRKGMMREEDWTRMARTLGVVNEAPLFIDDSPNMTLTEIRAKCRRLKQRHDLRLVVIDYLQLMTSGKRVESRQQEVSEFSRALKLLAKELEVPVIAISQLNRGPEQRTDKKPQMSDLRESGSIEQDADMVILLHREDAYERESPRAGEADLIVAKHRNGPTDTIVVAFQGHYSRFVDMATG